MGFDIAVTRDLNGIRAALKQRAAGRATSRVEGIADGIMLTGSAASPAEAQQAYDLAARLAGDGNKVVNGITVRGRDQVMLKVTVAEVQRDVIKQLGIDLERHAVQRPERCSISPTPTRSRCSARRWSTPTPSPATYRGVSATLRAMERAGVIRTLAEPNLTAISGETANFLAGGEFPIPAGFTCDPTTRNCQTQIQFKKFGVGLNFTPVVLSEGRISLKVLTEVSELSNDNALTLTQAISASQTTTLTIPSIKTRRAETTVEIPSGGSLAMAGMIQEQTKQQLNGMPGLMNLPVLGALFKSRDYINRQTELMVLVTPYVVRAVAQKDLSRPDDGYADASDRRHHPARPLQPALRHAGTGRSASEELPRQCRLHSRLRRATRRRSMHSDILNVARRRAAALGARGLLIAGFAAALAGCNTTTAQDTTGSIPNDYRERHPIAMKEGKQTLDAVRRRRPRRALADAARRGAGLRAELEARSHRRRHHRPAGRRRQRARRQRHVEGSAVDPRAGRRAQPRHRHPAVPADGNKLATLRLNYPLMVAEAGPCGLWPDDLGPSYDPKHFENQQYYNFGCATQRNLAAMVANPADLVQPRAEDARLHRQAHLRHRQVAQGREPGDDLSRRQQGRDQRSGQMIRTALQTVTPEPAPAEPAPRDEHIAPAPRVSVQAFCETVETAAAIQSAGEDRRLGKAHRQDPDGRHHRRDRSLSRLADAQRHHAGDRRPRRRHPDRPRCARRSSATPAPASIVIGRHQRRHALSRAGPARRQRLPDRAGRHASTSCARSAACSPRPTPSRSAASSPWSAPRAASAPPPSPTTSPGRWRAILRSIRVVTDLDLAFGTAGLDYNQDPPQGIADAVFSPDRIDTAFVDRLLSKCTDHLSLLAAPATLERAYDFGAEAFDGIFDALRATMPCIVLDVPHQWTGWTQRTLVSADDILIVAAPDLANLRNAKNLFDYLRAARVNDHRPFYCLNQVGVPKRPEIKPADFAKALEDQPVAVIPFEPQTVRHRRQQRPDDRRSVGEPPHRRDVPAARAAADRALRGEEGQGRPVHAAARQADEEVRR